MWAIGVVPTLLHLAGSIWLLCKMPAEFWAYPVEPFGMSLGVRSLLLLPLSCLPLVTSWVMTRLATIVVTDEGLTLHRVWKLRWEDATSARLRIVFGARYLRVSRGQPRIGLSIPLEYIRDRSLVAALIELVPPGNPIRDALDQAR